MNKNKKIILLIIGFLAIFSFVFAKYVSNTVWDYYLKTKGFYFSSDHLEKNNVNNLWDGSEVYFNVKNSLNQEVITDYDIEYTVSCSVVDNDQMNCYMNGTDSNTFEDVLLSSFKCIDPNLKTEQSYGDKESCELEGFEWRAQEVKDELYFEIDSNNQTITDIKVEVKATSNHPYKKTIIGYFILNKSKDENELIKSYQNYLNYDLLVISNPTTSSKCIKVKWDTSKLLIEKTNFNIYRADADGYIDEFDIEIGSNKSLSYVFYKKNFSNNYSVSDFIITETTGCS